MPTGTYLPENRKKKHCYTFFQFRILTSNRKNAEIMWGLRSETLIMSHNLIALNYKTFLKQLNFTRPHFEKKLIIPRRIKFGFLCVIVFRKKINIVFLNLDGKCGNWENLLDCSVHISLQLPCHQLNNFKASNIYTYSWNAEVLFYIRCEKAFFFVLYGTTKFPLGKKNILFGRDSFENIVYYFKIYSPYLW